MAMKHIVVSCSDEGAEFDLELTKLEARGVQKVIDAYLAQPGVDDLEWCGPWILMTEGER